MLSIMLCACENCSRKWLYISNTLAMTLSNCVTRSVNFDSFIKESQVYSCILLIQMLYIHLDNKTTKPIHFVGDIDDTHSLWQKKGNRCRVYQTGRLPSYGIDRLLQPRKSLLRTGCHSRWWCHQFPSASYGLGRGTRRTFEGSLLLRLYTVFTLSWMYYFHIYIEKIQDESSMYQASKYHFRVTAFQ